MYWSPNRGFLVFIVGINFSISVRYQNIRIVTLSYKLNFIEATIDSIYKKLKELKIYSTSIAKTPEISNIKWSEVLNIFNTLFTDFLTKVIICLGTTKYANKEQKQLIEDVHSAALGEQKEVKKTYNRIRKNVYWQNMKIKVQKYIQSCLKCQIKKLVRVKTKNSMAITDCPGTAFEEISMDIVESLLKTQRENEYI